MMALVPTVCDGGLDILLGEVVTSEVDENVGLVFVVRFPSGNTARLTPREVVLEP